MPSPITCPCGESFENVEGFEIHAMTCNISPPPTAGRWGRQRPAGVPISVPESPLPMVPAASTTENLSDFQVEPYVETLALGSPADAARARNTSLDHDSRYQPATGGVDTVREYVTGVGLMLIAVVWFVVGFFGFDTIYFYPPVVFLIGLGKVVLASRSPPLRSDRED